MPRKPGRGKCRPVPSKVVKPVVNAGAILLAITPVAPPGLDSASAKSGCQPETVRKQLLQTAGVETGVS